MILTIILAYSYKKVKIMIMKRYYILYKGQVQGVGFRWKIVQLAHKYNLTGYVKNLDNGDVAAEVQGNGVDEFLKESIEQDFYIIVDDYIYKEIELNLNEKTFRVDY